MLGTGWPDDAKKAVNSAFGIAIGHKMRPEALIGECRRRGYEITLHDVVWDDELGIISATTKFVGRISGAPRAQVVTKPRWWQFWRLW